MAESLSQHRRTLARELLDDIELSRLPATQLVLKAVRLASLSDDEEAEKWLGFESGGYVKGDKVSLRYMGLTNRWIAREQNIGWWGSLGQIEAQLEANKLELQHIRVPDVQFGANPANPHEAVWQSANIAAKPAADALARMKALNSFIAQLGGVRSRVLHRLHKFVASEFYLLEFSALAETVFEKHKSRLDEVLRERAGEVLKKVPAIYARLTEGDQEAISQALTSCRRIIDAFADAVYPARKEPVLINGKPIEVGADKTLNRIAIYVAERTTSESRQERVRKTLSQLYGRVNAGVHADVTRDEAMTLFLQTYLTLGEIAMLSDPVSPAAPAQAP